MAVIKFVKTIADDPVNIRNRHFIFDAERIRFAVSFNDLAGTGRFDVFGGMIESLAAFDSDIAVNERNALQLVLDEKRAVFGFPFRIL